MQTSPAANRFTTPAHEKMSAVPSGVTPSHPVASRRNALDLATLTPDQRSSHERLMVTRIEAMLQDLLARGELLRRTGIDNDVLTFWIRRGLVRPVESGSGTGRHLRFAFYEANIAAVMNLLRGCGLNIDALSSIAGIYRSAIAWAQDMSLARPDLFAADDYRNATWQVNAGTISQQQYDQELARMRQLTIAGVPLSEKHIEMASAMSDDQLYARHFYNLLAITDQPQRSGSELTYFWPSQDGWRISYDPDRASEDNALALVAVNIHGALHNVWHPA